jgi:tetratricopeptide (TPR) repeat protein
VVKVGSGERLWSQTFDREPTDIFAMQDEISRAVVQALRVELLPGESSIAKEYRPKSQEAYQSYLVGMHFAQSFSEDSSRREIEAFEKAIQIDPEYPQAWAALANARRGSAAFRTPFAEARRAARIAANRAVELAPNSPVALSARAGSRLADWEWPGAKADIDRALEVDPENIDAMWAMSGYLGCMGRDLEAVSWDRRIVDREPLSSNAWNTLGVHSWFSGQYDEAERAFDQAAEVDPTFRPFLHRALLLVDAGRPAEALGHCKGSYCLAIVQHALGNKAEAQKALDELLSNPAGDWRYIVAKVLAFRGETDRAFEWLERAVAERARMLWFLKSDPSFRRLHSDPRWAELLRKMNLPVD